MRMMVMIRGNDEDDGDDGDDDDDDDEEEEEVEEDDVEEEGRSQDWEAHLCEAVQATCTGTFHKSHSVWKFTSRKGRGHLRGHRFVRACAVEMRRDMS